jgi:hypothetical protein
MANINPSICQNNSGKTVRQQQGGVNAGTLRFRDSVKLNL